MEMCKYRIGNIDTEQGATAGKPALPMSAEILEYIKKIKQHRTGGSAVPNHDLNIVKVIMGRNTLAV